MIILFVMSRGWTHRLKRSIIHNEEIETKLDTALRLQSLSMACLLLTGLGYLGWVVFT